MSVSATNEGTTHYAKRFAGRAAEGHFRKAHELVLSSLGIGTYLGQPDDKTDEGYTAAVVAAVESGINVIDAAINYRFQRSERSIGAAIKQLAKKGMSREEFVICTKGGYLAVAEAHEGGARIGGHGRGGRSARRGLPGGLGRGLVRLAAPAQ
jgi:aryl-alcohol dehydrogenase-like predicted oxidoreductase